jgi:hypothetical protein
LPPHAGRRMRLARHPTRAAMQQGETPAGLSPGDFLTLSARAKLWLDNVPPATMEPPPPSTEGVAWDSSREERAEAEPDQKEVRPRNRRQYPIPMQAHAGPSHRRCRGAFA